MSTADQASGEVTGRKRGNSSTGHGNRSVPAKRDAYSWATVS